MSGLVPVVMSSVGVSSKRGEGLGVDRSGGSNGPGGGDPLPESGDTRFLLGIKIIGGSSSTSAIFLFLDGSASDVSSGVLDTMEASPLVSEGFPLYVQYRTINLEVTAPKMTIIALLGVILREPLGLPRAKRRSWL